MDKKKKIGQALFIVASAILLWCGLTYGSGLLFFKLNKMPLNYVGLMTIWDYFAAYKSHPVKFIRTSVILCTFAPYIAIVATVLVVIFAKNKERALHGDARFATLAEIKKAGLIDPPKGTEKTILVGKYKNHYLTYGGYQFVMLAAPTRSGKGVGVVIPNCLNYSDSLVVLDIKLENFDITSGFRAKHGQEVYLFSPFDTKARTHRYNPLSYISKDPAERLGDIDAIAAALFVGDEKDKFWSENAKDLFRGICLMVLEHPTLPKTLGEILRQASGKGKPVKEHLEEMLAKGVDDKKTPYSAACRDALGRILGNSENTLSGIVATFNTPLLIFQNPRVDLATSANDFDLRDVRRKRMTIYLGVTPDKLKDAAVIINLFFDQLLNLNTRVLPQQDPTLKYQCLLILDEFTAIGKVNMIQQAISYQAGYNMRVLTIIQNKSQLEDKYGKSGAITLMANHALMIMYAPSPVVQSDANEYSEMLGYETVKSKNKSNSYSGIGGNGSRSVSESDQKRALMLPQEIKELGQWREIVSLENCKPILCDKIKYFEDEAFTKRTNWKKAFVPTQDVDAFLNSLKENQSSFEDSMAKDNDTQGLKIPSAQSIVSAVNEHHKNKYYDMDMAAIEKRLQKQDNKQQSVADISSKDDTSSVVQAEFKDVAKEETEVNVNDENIDNTNGAITNTTESTSTQSNNETFVITKEQMDSFEAALVASLESTPDAIDNFAIADIMFLNFGLGPDDPKPAHQEQEPSLMNTFESDDDI